MPVRKRQRRATLQESELQDAENVGDGPKVMVRMVDEGGKPTGSQMLLPASATPQQLDELLCAMFEDAEAKTIPYAFFIEGKQVNESVESILFQKQKDEFVDKMLKEGRRVRPQDVDKLVFDVPEETVVSIVYKPQAVFRVRPVTRCAGTLDGHSEAVLVVCFSPDSTVLATGSGDKEIRIWDMATLSPVEELKLHTSWVQVLSWSADGQYLTSGSKDGMIAVWTHDGEYGKFKGTKYKAHNNYVSHISWEPLHKNIKCDRFVSASKDASLKVWHVKTGIQFSLSGHQSCVTCVKWGGEDCIYSSSQDRTIIVWDAKNGSQKSVLKGHAHWVNFLALSTDLVIRTGAFDHEGSCLPAKMRCVSTQRSDTTQSYHALVTRKDL
ncbi:ribosome assembly protein 4 [Strigomonas culicis]|uniref:Ribosome assembly protein 4 n=1 Tax=Strigomonas culicis TaxID=28005 RepID=S9UY40_9TRYP|nr:ribosome assembly protein 4 [Strigomonas culicis]|eukprot:EPY19501.1 ribosome assembly protein 4 [Strigomonas culicis]